MTEQDSTQSSNDDDLDASASPPPPRKRRILRRSLVVVSALLACALGTGAYIYLHLDGNLHHAPLDLGPVAQAPEPKNAAGRSPLNILVIGSDTRSTAADCRIVGNLGCGPGANADTEMLVHVSADRADATVLSIPRDTVVDIPRCTDPKTGHVYAPMLRTQITTSLQNGGPGCTVAAVHALTGVTIDHFVMSDFSGAVAMSDTLGGVQVCVDNNIYDPYSNLKLSKGTHTLKGLAALEFLHTRYGFGDGSDLGREEAQHSYLSALIQKLKNSGALTNPVTLYKLLNTATKALTVDDGLAGLPHLAGLASLLNQVPPSRIVFLTMPNAPYPANSDWVIPAPTAAAVFRSIAEDQTIETRPSSDRALPSTFLGQDPSNPSGLRTAADPPGCVAVSTQDTTPFGSPVHAYAVEPGIPNSAP